MILMAVCFTSEGMEICHRLEHICMFLGHQFQSFFCIKNERTTMSLTEWTKMAFEQAQGILFVGACGIAVRAIAPFLRGKTVDPAVIVIDTKGEFVIPILSGHWGGANVLAKELADKLCAVPVITTATDINGLFSVDTWAKRQNISIDMDIAKKISAYLLKGKKVGVATDFSAEPLPEGLEKMSEGELGMCISIHKSKKPFAETLSVFPPVVYLGIGCRKNIDDSVIENAVNEVLQKNDIAIESICGVCTIEAKKKEPGLNALCNKNNWKLITYTSEELNKAEGIFSSSDFVLEQMGVDNVCERAAVLSGSQLIVQKTVYQGVTVAASIKNWSVVWDG